MSNSLFGYLFAPLANTSYFIRNALIRKKTLNGYNSSIISFYIGLFTLISSFFFCIFSLRPDFIKNIFNLKILLLIIFIGSIQAVAFIWTNKLLKSFETTYINALQTLIPGIAAVLAIFILNEKLHLINYMGLFIISIAVFLITISEKNGNISNSIRSLFSNKLSLQLFITILIWSLIIPLQKYVVQSIGMFLTLFLNQVISLLVQAVILKINKTKVFSGFDNVKTTLPICFISTTAFLCEKLGYFIIPIGYAAILRNFAIPINALIAIIWLKEKNIKSRAVISIIAGIGGILSTFK